MALLAGVFDAYLDDLAVGLKAYYGATNPTLASFGVPVKHPPAKLPADKLVMKAARAKLRILEVPLPYRCRAGGESKVAGSLRGTLRAGTRIVTTFARVALA